MFETIFRLFRKATQNRRVWEHVGRISYGKIEGEIPQWVLATERQIRQKHGGTSSSLLNKFFYVKGRHFEYRISYGGQGGPIVEIERRKRRRR